MGDVNFLILCERSVTSLNPGTHKMMCTVRIHLFWIFAYKKLSCDHDRRILNIVERWIKFGTNEHGTNFANCGYVCRQLQSKVDKETIYWEIRRPVSRYKLQYTAVEQAYLSIWAYSQWAFVFVLAIAMSQASWFNFLLLSCSHWMAAKIKGKNGKCKRNHCECVSAWGWHDFSRSYK